MLTLKELQSRYAKPGVVDAIWLRPARGEDMVATEQAEITEAGLAGDRARKGKRAITLIQAEHLPVIAALFSVPIIEMEISERCQERRIFRGRPS